MTEGKKQKIIMALPVLLLCLTACGQMQAGPGAKAQGLVENVTEAVVPGVTEEETGTAEAAVETEDEKIVYPYAQIYLDEADNLYRDGKADRFVLTDVDGDEVPELLAVCSEGVSFYDTVFLYTVYGDELRLLESNLAGRFRCHLEYSEGNNLIYTGGGNDVLFERLEEIENGEIKELLTLEQGKAPVDANGDGVYDDDVWEPYYSVDYDNTSREEYYGKIWEKISALNPFTRVEYDGMHILTFAWKDGEIEERETEVRPYLTYAEITEELVGLGADTDALQHADESTDGAGSSDKKAAALLLDFAGGKIPAKHDDKSYMVDDLFMYGNIWESYRFGGCADLDNDGEDELILSGPYGGIYLDALNGAVYELTCGFGTSEVVSYVEFEGATWIVHRDTMHQGRRMYYFTKYDGHENIVDSFELNAEYWDNPDDTYDENSDFTFRGKKITMEEYEALLEEIFGTAS
ncbi:MAG: hypothetical protein J5518_11275 [Lachnospiraceae bacterium]|nr:hypothetical protein [Lachnospiraceae bacterium]